jgi:hypothetical protein
MSATCHRLAAAGCAAAAVLLLLLCVSHPAAAATPKLTECQHPTVTGVEVYHLHGIASKAACPVAMALYRWETRGSNRTKLYGCRQTYHAFLRLKAFQGWKLSLTPDFTMTRGGASFSVTGTDFPVSCT